MKNLMKKLLTCICIFGVLTFSTIVTYAEENKTQAVGIENAEYIVYTVTGVNLRESGSLDAPIINKLSPGTEVIWVYESEDRWTQVMYDETVGWIKSDYITNNKDDVIYKAPNPYQSVIDNMSSQDYEYLARMVTKEAGGEPFDGQVAVVEACFNRVLSSSYKNTVYGVIYEKGQFTTAKRLNSTKAFSSCYSAIEYVKQNGPTVLPSLRYVYFSTGGSNGKDKVRIHRHIFGRE